jgi:hypothetical protein
MADITVNKNLSRARLKTHVLEMQLQLQRMDERRISIQDELDKIKENEVAAQKDLAETQHQLELLGA